MAIDHLQFLLLEIVLGFLKVARIGELERQLIIGLGFEIEDNRLAADQPALAVIAKAALKLQHQLVLASTERDLLFAVDHAAFGRLAIE